MDQAVVDDLKQCIGLTSSQQAAGIRQDMQALEVRLMQGNRLLEQKIAQDMTKLEQWLEQRLEKSFEQKIGQAIKSSEQKVMLRVEHLLEAAERRIGQKIDDVSAYIAEALDMSNDATGKQLKITKSV